MYPIPLNINFCRGGGNVLVAVDTAGRVLELAHMMDQLWGNKASNKWLITITCSCMMISYNMVRHDCM